MTAPTFGVMLARAVVAQHGEPCDMELPTSPTERR
jgi:hypothetical protein